MVALSSMLPVAIQFIIAMVAYAINERMARRLEYVQEEVRVLREALAEATGNTRVAFTPEQRRRLALKGKVLTPQEREGCCQSVRPSTILALFRELAARTYDGSGQRRKPGGPRKSADIGALVIRLKSEGVKRVRIPERRFPSNRRPRDTTSRPLAWAPVIIGALRASCPIQADFSPPLVAHQATVHFRLGALESPVDSSVSELTVVAPARLTAMRG